MDESKKFGKYENYGEMIFDHKRNVTHPWHFFPTVYGEFYKIFNQRNTVYITCHSVSKTNEQTTEPAKKIKMQ